MAAQPFSESEEEASLIDPAQPSPGSGSHVLVRHLAPFAVGRLAPFAAAAFLLLAVVGLLPQGPATPAQAPQRQALSAGPARANASEASGLWGAGQPGTCMQCQQMGGSCCVDRPLVCCWRAQICNVGRCAPNPRFAGGYGYGGRPASPGYGYGGRPGYGSNGGNLLQRMGGWLSSLNPFNRRPPTSGSGGYGNGGYGNGGYGNGGNGGSNPLLQRLGGSVLQHMLR